MAAVASVSTKQRRIHLETVEATHCLASDMMRINQIPDFCEK